MNVETLCIQSLFLIAPVLFTLFYSVFACRKINNATDSAAFQLAVSQRCVNVTLFCWCLYLIFTWVVLNKFVIFDIAPSGLLNNLGDKFFSIFIGILSIIPLIGSYLLYLIVSKWVWQRVRKENSSLIPFLRFYLALWLWRYIRYLFFLVLIMSQTFIFIFDGTEITISFFNIAIIGSFLIPVYYCNFGFIFSLFGLIAPLENQEIKNIADNLGNKFGVTIQRIFRIRTLDIPLTNVVVSTSKDIYLSDVIIGSFEREEIEAILALECAQIKQIEKISRRRFFNALGLLFLLVGVFPLSLIVISNISFMLLLLIVGGNFMLWFAIKEKQFERNFIKETDLLAANIVGKDVYIKSLTRLHQLNMLPVPSNDNEKIYFSHPSFEERINSLSVVSFERS